MIEKLEDENSLHGLHIEYHGSNAEWPVTITIPNDLMTDIPDYDVKVLPLAFNEIDEFIDHLTHCRNMLLKKRGDKR